jgi:hypothetical protein
MKGKRSLVLAALLMGAVACEHFPGPSFANRDTVALTVSYTTATGARRAMWYKPGGSYAESTYLGPPTELSVKDEQGRGVEYSPALLRSATAIVGERYQDWMIYRDHISIRRGWTDVTIGADGTIAVR